MAGKRNNRKGPSTAVKSKKGTGNNNAVQAKRQQKNMNSLYTSFSKYAQNMMEPEIAFVAPTPTPKNVYANCNMALMSELVAEPMVVEVTNDVESFVKMTSAGDGGLNSSYAVLGRDIPQDMVVPEDDGMFIFPFDLNAELLKDNRYSIPEVSIENAGTTASVDNEGFWRPGKAVLSATGLGQLANETAGVFVYIILEGIRLAHKGDVEVGLVGSNNGTDLNFLDFTENIGVSGQNYVGFVTTPTVLNGFLSNNLQGIGFYVRNTSNVPVPLHTPAFSMYQNAFEKEFKPLPTHVTREWSLVELIKGSIIKSIIQSAVEYKFSAFSLLISNKTLEINKGGSLTGGMFPAGTKPAECRTDLLLTEITSFRDYVQPDLSLKDGSHGHFVPTTFDDLQFNRLGAITSAKSNSPAPSRVLYVLTPPTEAQSINFTVRWNLELILSTKEIPGISSVPSLMRLHTLILAHGLLHLNEAITKHNPTHMDDIKRFVERAWAHPEVRAAVKQLAQAGVDGASKLLSSAFMGV
jgi:hypothetical protein